MQSSKQIFVTALLFIVHLIQSVHPSHPLLVFVFALTLYLSLFDVIAFVFALSLPYSLSLSYSLQGARRATSHYGGYLMLDHTPDHGIIGMSSGGGGGSGSRSGDYCEEDNEGRDDPANR